MERLVTATRERWGKIDNLVVNAAVNPYYGSSLGIPDSAFDKVMEVNIRSVHWLCQMVIPEMQERKDGSIVIVSSVGGFRGNAVLGAYAISKAADMQLARNLAAEFGPDNIRVNRGLPWTGQDGLRPRAVGGPGTRKGGRRKNAAPAAGRAGRLRGHRGLPRLACGFVDHGADVHRRRRSVGLRLIRFLVALVLLAARRPRSRPATPRTRCSSPAAFALGEVGATTAVVWTRTTAEPQRRSGEEISGRPVVTLARGSDVSSLEGAVPGEPGEVRVVVRPAASADEPAGRAARRTSGWYPTGAERDFTHQATFDDLTPNARYLVTVEARPAGGGADAPATAIETATFRTAPASDERLPVRFAAMTCQYYGRRDRPDGFRIYPSMAAGRPDFYLSIGDNVYYDNESPRATSVELARYHWQRMFTLPAIASPAFGSRLLAQGRPRSPAQRLLARHRPGHLRADDVRGGPGGLRRADARAGTPVSHGPLGQGRAALAGRGPRLPLAQRHAGRFRQDDLGAEQWRWLRDSC